MKRKRAESVDALIAQMGRERVALRTKRLTVVLLVVASLLCLFSAVASLMSLIPYAVGPSVVLILAAAVGFGLAVLEARAP
jgi:hypothetical protein